MDNSTTSCGSDPRRWWVLGALSAVLVLVGLDLTVLNVAIPLIATDLGATIGELQWVVNAYTVVLAALLLPVGRLGDRFGRRRLLLAGLAVFGIASVLCAFAPTPEWLIAGRALLGLGAALLNTLGLAVLVAVFPAEERPRAIAVQALATSAGIPLGPIVGGLLVDSFWWGSVFLLNVPLVVIVGVALAVLVPETRADPAPRLDVVGGLLGVTGLGAVSFGVIHAGEAGWADRLAVIGTVVGTVLLVAFVAHQRRVDDPVADLGLFAEPRFSWGSGLSAAVQFVVFGVMFLLPQYFQVAFGADPLGTGLALLPLVVVMLGGVLLAGALRPELGARGVLVLGFVVLAAGLAAGAMTTPASGLFYAAVWTGLVGFGFGASMPAAIDIAVAAVPTEAGGAGSALLQAQRQVGAVLGVAIMGSVLAGHYRADVETASVPPGFGPRVELGASSGMAVAHDLGDPGLAAAVSAAFVHGMGGALWVAAAVAVLCAVAAGFVGPDPVRAQAAGGRRVDGTLGP